MTNITYTFPTGDAAEAMVKKLTEMIENYGHVSISDFKGLVGLKANLANEKWGWTTIEGIHHHPTREGEELVFPPATDLEDLLEPQKFDIKFQHVMPSQLAAELDSLAAKMGTSRRGLMNVLLYQTIRNQPYN